MWLLSVMKYFIIHLHLRHDAGNAESASLDARLAAVKLGDGFSIADSALGRSSVASVTTAGVTQFSEVSLINDSYCLSQFYNSNIPFLGCV